METISQWLAVTCGLAWFSLHVDDMPMPSHHVELALNMDNMTATATSCQLVLLSAAWKHCSDQEWWMRDWRIAISILKRTAMLFHKGL